MKVNKIPIGVDKISMFLIGETKWGKTTLFADTVMEKFNDPEYGCMLAIGGENPTTMLDYVGVEQIDSYKDFDKAIKDLCDRAESYEKVKMVAIDTVDELVPMLEAKALDEWNHKKALEARDNGQRFKETKSVEAMGFNRGPIRAAQFLKEAITTLRRAGFGVWVIGHSARKAQSNKTSQEGNEVSYERLKSSLSKNYDDALRGIMDMTLTGTIEFEDFDERVEQDFRGKSKTIRSLNSLGTRYLYFRETPFVDASCYFAMGTVPDRIKFDKSDNSRLFIDTIEEGQKLSSVKYRKKAGKVAEEERAKLEQLKEELKKEAETKPDPIPEEEPEVKEEAVEPAKSEPEPVEEVIEELEDELEEVEEQDQKYTEEEIKALQNELKTKFKTADKEKKKAVREKMNAVGTTVSKCPPEMLEELINALA